LNLIFRPANIKYSAGQLVSSREEPMKLQAPPFIKSRND